MPSVVKLPFINEVRLVGRLTRDPELRFTGKGSAVCRFDIAVNRRYKDTATGEWKDDTSFVSIIAWRELGQRCGDRLKKGHPVYVEGRLKSSTWEGKDGQKRSKLEVDARGVQFLEKLGEGAGAAAGGDDESSAPVPEAEPAGEPAASETEEIPF
jgi:single-strand DNA-binding protein